LNNQANQKKVRFRYFIDKPFQTKFILRFVIVILIGLAITLGILGYYSQTKFKEGLYFTTKEVANISASLQNQSLPYPDIQPKGMNRLDLFWKPVIFTSVFYILLLMIFGLFYSHRMAGPLYRIQKNLKELKQGESVTEIQIRKNDHFQELVGLLNDLLKKIKK
jgi:nitrogen fixation/metabolism regulation signal transduction histidine kinase